MRRLLLAACLLLAGCSPGSPGTTTPGGAGSGQWSYAKGPHGENCLFYKDGAGYATVIAMSCDKVSP